MRPRFFGKLRCSDGGIGRAADSALPAGRTPDDPGPLRPGIAQSIERVVADLQRLFFRE